MKDLITQERIDALAPGARDLFVWDTDLPGFGLKLTPSGRRVYIYQYRSGGRPSPTKRITIGGEAEGWSAGRARDRAAELSQSLRAGKTPAPPAPDGPGEDWEIRLGFVVADISRLQAALLRKTMKSLGGTHAQWGMLGRLAAHQGITQMELADRLNLSKVAITGLVDRAVRAGWVERRLDENDRRVRRLYLTPRALAAVHLMREKVDAMTAASMDHIPNAEGQALLAALDSIRQRLLGLQRRQSRRKSE